MNPFLVDPVAIPVTTKLSGEWKTISFARRSSRPFRYRAGKLALAAAGLGASLGGTFVAHAIDVNVASVAELERLRGIGPRTAQMIVQERERAGAFESLTDLSERVRGIGAQRVKVLHSVGLRVGTSDNTSVSHRPGPQVVDGGFGVSRQAGRDGVTPVLMPGVIVPAEHK
jgi:competence protein ComEA